MKLELHVIGCSVKDLRFTFPCNSKNFSNYSTNPFRGRDEYGTSFNPERHFKFSSSWGFSERSKWIKISFRIETRFSSRTGHLIFSSILALVNESAWMRFIDQNERRFHSEFHFRVNSIWIHASKYNSNPNGFINRNEMSSIRM